MRNGTVWRLVGRYWPELASVAVLWTIIIGVLVASLRHNDGHLVYALDDAYIHMALAKNLALHGIWGPTSDSFSSSGSSLLWPLLIAATYRLVGVNDLSPFVLNVVLATCATAVVCRISRAHGASQPLTLTTGLLFIFATPLVALIFSGMEHTLQTVLVIVLAWRVARFVINRDSPREWPLVVLTIVLAATRYEGLFLVAAGCGILLLYGRWRTGARLALAAATPVCLYGVISLGRGWWFLPNSVFLKATVFPPEPLARAVRQPIYGAAKNMFDHPAVLVLVLLGAFLLAALLQSTREDRPPDAVAPMLAIFLATAWIHMQLVVAAHYYRFEAYLVAFGIIAIIPVLRLRILRPEMPISASVFNGVAIASLIAACGLPLFGRSRSSLLLASLSTSNIYEQQYQMGLFLKRYYDGQAVAANDIGAVTYLADIRLLDLMGLSNMRIAQARMAHNLNEKLIGSLATQMSVKVAIVYDSWFDGNLAHLPASWIRLGSWRIENNVVCGDDRVSFYAVEVSEKRQLVANLRDFAAHLPKDVSYTISAE